MLLLIILLVLIFGGGGGYYLGNAQQWPGGGYGSGLGTIVVVLLVLWLAGFLRR
jgi:hypothetical protein